MQVLIHAIYNSVIETNLEMGQKKKSTAVISSAKKERNMLRKEHVPAPDNIPSIQDDVNEKDDELDQASEGITSSMNKRTDDNIDEHLREEVSVYICCLYIHYFFYN